MSRELYKVDENHSVLNINIQEIQVTPGTIVFNEFEQLKEQALQLAANIETVEVNEENIQVSKKLLAAVNKRVKEMEEKRISIKKEILQPYETFESMVKEIVSIVKNADNKVREQIHELEEIEREEKRNAIHDIYNKRIQHYFFGETFTFEDFLKPQHLNKSVSMKSIETDMVTWLEKIEADILVINGLPNSEEVLTEYYDTKDLGTALRIINDRNERKQQVSQLVKPQVSKKTYTITLENEKDFILSQLLLQQNNIKFTVEKVEN